MLEVVFKIGLTFVVVGALGVALHWIWTNHLDPKETLSRLVRRPIDTLRPPEWVAARDPAKIYQDGKPVGDVSVEPQIEGTRVTFSSIANTGDLGRDAPFEYQRMKLRILRWENWYGEVTSSVGETVHKSANVLTGVECELID